MHPDRLIRLVWILVGASGFMGGAFSASAQVVIRERVEVERPTPPPADSSAQMRLRTGLLDSRWADPLRAPGALWDVWIYGDGAWSPTALPLGGHLTVREPRAVEATSVPVGLLFDLTAPEPVTSIPTSSNTWRLGGNTFVHYPGLYRGSQGGVGVRSQMGGPGAVRIGLVDDTLFISSETVTPFGNRGPDWFEYGFNFDWAHVFGDQLRANNSEPTARCSRFSTSPLAVFCGGDYRSGFYWYDGGAYVDVSLWAWAVTPSQLVVETDAPAGGLRLGERAVVTVRLTDIEREAPDDTPVTVWIDSPYGPAYGHLVDTATGARADTLALTLGEVRAGRAAFEVQSEPANFGTQTRIRVEPDFDAPAAPTPAYTDVQVNGVDVYVDVSTTEPRVGNTVTVSGRVEGWPGADPLTPGVVTPSVYEPGLDVTLLNTRTGQEVAGPADESPELPITLADLLSGAIRVTLTGEVATPDPSGGQLLRLHVSFGDARASSPDLSVRPGAPLTVTATPNSVQAGGEARFTVEAPGLDPGTPVTFTVSDLAVGGFPASSDTQTASMRVAGAENEPQRLGQVTRPLADAGDVRFVAADQAPDSAATVTVTVTADGRTGKATVTVQPAAIVQLIRQNDSPIPSKGSSAYVMVSKVRPDWLLPETSDFAAPPNLVMFENAGEADPALHYDHDTYRPEVVHVPDSLMSEPALARFRFRYEVVRNGVVVHTNDPPAALQNAELQTPDVQEQTDTDNAKATAQLRSGTLGSSAVAGLDSAGVNVVRARQHVRLVSNGRPAVKAASGCAKWPPVATPNGKPKYSVPGDGGDCAYDDEVAGQQTILVRLGDRLRVTVYVESAVGAVADTLGRFDLPVGQPAMIAGVATQSIDSIRRVDLVWHEYVQVDGKRLTSDPVLAANRMSEDWAQASVYFASKGPADSFTAAGAAATTIEVQTPAPASSSGTVDLLVTPRGGAPTPVQAQYDAGMTAFEIAERIEKALQTVTTSDSGKLRASIYFGQADNLSAYAVIDGSQISGLTVQGVSDVNIIVLQRLEPLEGPREGSEAASAAGSAFSDSDLTTADVFVVPRTAIQQGDPTSNTLAYALSDLGDPRLFVTSEVAMGDDSQSPHTMGHEAGHLLLAGGVSDVRGGPECSADQEPKHNPEPYNIMFCAAIGSGERVGGPKRLTPGQHVQTRPPIGGDVRPLIKTP